VDVYLTLANGAIARAARDSWGISLMSSKLT